MSDPDAVIHAPVTMRLPLQWRIYLDSRFLAFGPARGSMSGSALFLFDPILYYLLVRRIVTTSDSDRKKR